MYAAAAAKSLQTQLIIFFKLFLFCIVIYFVLFCIAD